MPATPENPAFDRYRAHAARLGKRFQDLSSEHVLRSVADFLPEPPADILDIGAGSGRDAAWLAQFGHRVTAVEPVDEMSRQAANLPGAERITWINDHLPDLTCLRDQEGTFDLCLISGVWHHVPDTDRADALAKIAALLRPGGRLVMSLRLGADADGRTIFPVDPRETLAQAADVGLSLLHRATTQSTQKANIAAGVTWEWLVLERPAGGSP